MTPLPPLTAVSIRPRPGRTRSWIRLPLRLWVWTVFGLGIVGFGELGAQEMSLPVDVQWSLFQRIVAFDRSFGSRTRDDLVVGVLYQSRYRPSLNARTDSEGSAKDLAANLPNGFDVRVVSIEAGTRGETTRKLREEGVDVLYITPLRSQSLPEISEIAQELGIMTLTGVREYVELGIGVGLGVRAGRPEIVINLEVCRAQGMDLSSELLKLATVLGSGPS